MIAVSELPKSLFTAAKTRRLDAIAIEQGPIAGIVLMERAGEAAFQCLRSSWPTARRLVVVCGLGNNAGDGYVLARHAFQAGLEVLIAQIGDVALLSGDARTAFQALPDPIRQVAASDADFDHADVLVDGIFGTGLSRDITGQWRAVIERLNRAGAAVLALDLPSGLDADTGRIHAVAVEADVCITFVGLKQGMFTALGPQHCGHVEFSDLAIPLELQHQEPRSAARVHYEMLKGLLTPRPRHTHKGHNGHVLVVGGDFGFAGAIRMAAEAAARVGAGLTSVATRERHVSALLSPRPELMCRGVETTEDLDTLLERASVVAVGPGLGRSEWGHELWVRLMKVDLPMVVDADALNLLAASHRRRESWILTPHPGEAARLLGSSTAEVESDRFAAVQALTDTFGGSVVLKGAGTLIGGGGHIPEVCVQGNPGMASGGMGDVLTGVIAGLLAQGTTQWDAARLGVCMHAGAADAAVVNGERGLLAMDLMPHLRRLANP